MGKDDTIFIKGIAIVMMMIIHIDLEKCSSFILPIGVWDCLQRLAIPVFCFIFCSGYGLYFSKEKRASERCKKGFKLWVIYQILTVVCIFLTVAINGGGKLQFSPIEIIYNILCIHTTWNGPGWFVLPYIFIISLSSILFRMIDRFNPLAIFLLYGMCFLTSGWIISREGINYVDSNPHIYNLCYFFFLLFPFYLGVICNKYNVFNRVNRCVHKLCLKKELFIIMFAVFVIFLSIIIQLAAKTSASVPIYGSMLIVSIVQILSITPFYNLFGIIVRFLGKHSMNIWIIHSFFLGNIFDIHILKYPIFILLGFLIISSGCSIVANKLFVSKLNIIFK